MDDFILVSIIKYFVVRILKTSIRISKRGLWTLNAALPAFCAWPLRIAQDWNQHLK